MGKKLNTGKGERRQRKGGRENEGGKIKSNFYVRHSPVVIKIQSKEYISLMKFEMDRTHIRTHAHARTHKQRHTQWLALHTELLTCRQ
jgi:hypothetical protein